MKSKVEIEMKLLNTHWVCIILSRLPRKKNYGPWRMLRPAEIAQKSRSTSQKCGSQDGRPCMSLKSKMIRQKVKATQPNPHPQLGT